ncbi:histidine triad protein D [Streptococcus pneumoniae]|nr:histidine triad protein D [Streptococcus pneumoniae]
MKINKKYLAGSVAVLALSVCSYELGRYQAGQDKKESNRVAYIDGDQAGQKAENLTPDEVSKREGINAEQIVIKITDQGYVTSHGDHYHYYNGKVPYDAIISEELLMKDPNYQLKDSDIVNEIKGGDFRRVLVQTVVVVIILHGFNFAKKVTISDLREEVMVGSSC